MKYMELHLPYQIPIFKMMASVNAKLKIGSVVCGRYRLTQKIGAGSFGEIHLAINVGTGEKVAVKLEHVRARCPQLVNESQLYKCLVGGDGFPLVKWCGVDGEYRLIIMELLGSSLEALFHSCSRKFSLKTIIMVTEQMLNRIEFLHSKFILHRDLKPDNFLIGVGPQRNKIYMIDFGLAKHYRDPTSLQHCLHRDGKGLTGSPRFASRNSHRGIELSRRDDLESLSYILLYFLRGRLPWQGMKGATLKQKYDKIANVKMITTVEQLCTGFPKEIAMLLMYSRALRFEEAPDYAYIRQLFRNLFTSLGYQNDFKFDWDLQTRKSTTPNRS